MFTWSYRKSTIKIEDYSFDSYMVEDPIDSYMVFEFVRCWRECIEEEQISELLYKMVQTITSSFSNRYFERIYRIVRRE